MQCHYEINVSKDGTHFFATAERSCVDPIQTRKVYDELAKRFTKDEGFDITVSYCDCSYRDVTKSLLM